MRRAHVAIQAFLLFSMLSPALASEHAGYWKQRTPTGKGFACKGAASQAQLFIFYKMQAGIRREGYL